MTKITIHADCGNSPKKELLRDLNIAFARADVDGILEFFTDDICWQIIGEFEMRGVDKVRDVLLQMQDVKVRELIIQSVITRGREGVINGAVVPETGNPVAFCDVCEFQSASGKKIKSMMSYTIELKEGS